MASLENAAVARPIVRWMWILMLGSRVFLALKWCVRSMIVSGVGISILTHTLLSLPTQISAKHSSVSMRSRGKINPPEPPFPNITYFHTSPHFPPTIAHPLASLIIFTPPISPSTFECS